MSQVESLLPSSPGGDQEQRWAGLALGTFEETPHPQSCFSMICGLSLAVVSQPPSWMFMSRISGFLASSHES